MIIQVGILVIAEVRPIKLEQNLQTAGVYMTCMGIYLSGAGIGILLTLAALCAAGRGFLPPITCVQRIGAAASRAPRAAL